MKNLTFFHRHFWLSLVTLLLLFGISATHTAQAGPGVNWSFQRTITLSSATPSANFQIRVQITDHSNMNADGSDLRFYDASDVQADYWIETWNMAGTSTVWVEVPTSGTTSLTMYYGNSGATAVSNGNTTFLAFDDFSGGSIDSSKWDAYGSPAIGSGSVTLDGGDQLISKTPFAMVDGVLVETVLSSNVPFRGGSRASLNGASSLSGSGTFFTADEPINSRFAVWSHGRDNIYGIHLIQDGDLSDNGNTQYIIIWDSGGPNTWAANGYILGTAFSSGRVEYFQNFTSMGVSTTNVPSGTLYPLLNNGLLSNSGLDPFSMTTFRVRKFAVGYSPIVTIGNAITVVTSGANGGDGPGGVGMTDGSSNLILWLRPDEGTFTNTGCTTVTTNGSSVGCWEDQSGSGNHVTQGTAGNRPTFNTNVMNGNPALSFDGNDYLATITTSILGGNSNYTKVSVSRLTASGGSYNLISSASGGIHAHFYLSTQPSLFHGSTFLTSPTGQLNNYIIFASTYNPTTPRAEILVNGSSQGIHNSPPTFTDGANTLIGRYTTGAYFIGEFPEAIIFDIDLTALERILVDNYLSAKYDITLDTGGGATDVYGGDTAGNGNFDLDVAGIGQTGGNQHTQAHSVGMIVVNDTFLNENGDWLLFGHNTSANSRTTADLPSGGDWDGANDIRWARHWYMDLTDPSANNGTVDIIFDFSEAGMDNDPALMPDGPASNYRLLKRTGATGQFSDITATSGATVVIVGDQVQFLGVDVSVLGSNFTLGSLDEIDSPTALTLQSFTARAAALPVVGLLALIGMGLIGLVFWRRNR